MDYALAEELKNAGFRDDIYLYPETKEVGNVLSLSELIAACPDFEALIRQLSLTGDTWNAINLHGYRGTKRERIVGHGRTPEEAVANLWLYCRH